MNAIDAAKTHVFALTLFNAVEMGGKAGRYARERDQNETKRQKKC